MFREIHRFRFTILRSVLLIKVIQLHSNVGLFERLSKFMDNKNVILYLLYLHVVLYCKRIMG